MSIPLRLFALVPSILAGCATNDPTEPYVGTWTYYRSDVKTQCDDQPDVVKDLVGHIVLTRSGDGELAIDTASQHTLVLGIPDTCTPRFSVGDTHAKLVPQAPCIFETANGAEITLTYHDYALIPTNITGPDIEPMTPGLTVELHAELWSRNGRCDVFTDALVL